MTRAATLVMRRMQNPGEHMSDAVNALRLVSRDLGAPGRDDTYGWGELAPNTQLSAESH
jgi:hypothetical protein